MSIRNDLNVDFKFPEPQELAIRLKDVLEPQVDEKYYLSDEQTKRLKMTTYNAGSEKARVQDTDGEARTLCARDYKDPKCVRVGGLYDKDGSRHQAGSIYDPNGVCATLSTMQGGNQEPIIVASRGRNPENPSDRLAGQKLEQRLEPNRQGITNTITSVQKDNYVAEPKLEFVGAIGDKDIVGDGKTLSRNCPQGNRVWSSDGLAASQTATGGGIGGHTGLYMEPTQTTQCCSTVSSAAVIIDDTYKNREPREYEDYSPTLRAGRSGLKVRTANKKGYDIATDGDGVDLSYPQSKTRRGRVGHGVSKTLMASDSMGTVDNYRIRKLTPKECWRLMGFDDADFMKAEQVNSNTQLYKQAGNSIVVNVLEGILCKLPIE